MKKFFACVLMTTLAFAFAGCNNAAQNTPEPENSKPAAAQTDNAKPEDLVIKESGWSQNKEGVFYGFEIENPNTKFEADFVNVKITGKDAEGTVIFSETELISFMLPGAKYYCANSMPCSGKIKNIEFTPSVNKNDWINNDKQSMEIYTITNHKETKKDEDYTNYTGEITAHEEWDDINAARVNVILRDDSGEIVGGGYTFVDNLNKDDTSSFDILMANAPKHSSYEITAYPNL